LHLDLDYGTYLPICHLPHRHLLYYGGSRRRNRESAGAPGADHDQVFELAELVGRGPVGKIRRGRTPIVARSSFWIINVPIATAMPLTTEVMNVEASMMRDP
jgi:hypothetical protein